MARPAKPSLAEGRRRSSMLHYQTFPTKPPASRGRPPSSSPPPNGEASGSNADSDDSNHHHESPLPVKQLAVLAVIALAEQTAFNSISPYLPEMASTFPEVSGDQVGLYVGLIASAFALAQFATNFFWGWLSDRIGRKPVILTGTILSAACFVAFGFCRTLWQAILVQICLGLVNGNQGVVSTCLGEITDRSNQSKAFTYLPVVYGLGAITGPAVGGLLVFKQTPYPYLLPNVFAACVLVIDLILTTTFLDESLQEAKELPPLSERVHSLFAWLWQFAGASHRPTYLRRGGHSKDDDEADEADEVASGVSIPTLLPDRSSDQLQASDVFHRDTVLLFVTYFIFQLVNIAYNSLYPIFGEASEPTGRNLTTEEIGLSLAFAGIITIVFQVAIFGRIREKMGNKVTYRASIALFVVAFVLMPWVGYKDKGGFGNGKVWLWIELGVVLVIKTVAAVGGLTSALLLITNSAPDHKVLGTLNGLAQTLSAGGRAAGPFISGGLFSAATKVEPKGEALAFGVFGGIAFVGFLVSFGIRGEGLEDDHFHEEGQNGDDESQGGDEDSHTPLLRRES